MDKRKHPRFRAAVAAEIEIDFELHEGETRDLSESGASVFLRVPLAENRPVQLTLLLTEDGIEAHDAEPLTLQAQVVWSAEQPTGGVLAGLRFVPPAGEDSARLAQLLAAVSKPRQA